MLSQALKKYSADLQQRGLYRQRQIDYSQATLNFSRNDYLSLASDFRIKKAYQVGFKHYPVGSSGSMMVCGYYPIHQELERAFSQALGVDDCVIFSSGYAANLSLTALLGRFDTHVLFDKGLHASLYEGLTQLNASYSRYLHNDLTDLSRKLKKSPPNTVLMTESIFSMSGQIAPLAKIAKLGKQYHCELLVDEAHAFGILGREGLGGVVHQGLTQEDVPLRVIPFGKAYAACGAIVAGQQVWIDALLQSARPYIYSTAISPAFAYGLLKTLEIIRQADERRTKLHELVGYFRQAISKSRLKWNDSHSPIQQLQLGCPYLALTYAAKLREQSIICLPMRQPTVSKQETGLRVILNYVHQPEDIDRLLNILELVRFENATHHHHDEH